MRVMGLDPGTKTVGVALSDELGFTAQALTTVRRTNVKADIRALAEIASEHGVERIVCGLPLNMNGSEGPAAQKARQLAQALEAELGLPVELWDERLSTVAAERVLLEGDVSREKRRKVIDRVAAAVILQGWLDAKRPPPDDGEGFPT